MEFKDQKCKGTYHHGDLGSTWTKSSFDGKKKGSSVNTRLNMNTKCAFTLNKTNLPPLWYSRGSMVRWMEKIVTPLYSVLVRLHLEHCVQFGVTLIKKNEEKLEKATRKVCSLEDLNKNRDWKSWLSELQSCIEESKAWYNNAP